MSIEHQLARITAGTLSLELSSGGRAELTRDDIRALLGFAEYSRRLEKRARKIKTPLKRRKPNPPDEMGGHIVLAKWTGDDISKAWLEEALARMAFIQWWDAEARDSEPVSRTMMRKLARLMIMDMCQPQQVRIHGAAGIEAMMGMSEETWDRKLSRHYANLMKECQHLEADVIKHLCACIN